MKATTAERARSGPGEVDSKDSTSLTAGSKKLRSLAIGAGSVGASAVGAFALGALAMGAVAVGVLAVRHLKIREAHIGSLEVDNLAVGQLRVGELDVVAVKRREGTLTATPEESGTSAAPKTL